MKKIKTPTLSTWKCFSPLISFFQEFTKVYSHFLMWTEAFHFFVCIVVFSQLNPCYFFFLVLYAHKLERNLPTPCTVAVECVIPTEVTKTSKIPPHKLRTTFLVHKKQRDQRDVSWLLFTTWNAWNNNNTNKKGRKWAENALSISITKRK